MLILPLARFARIEGIKNGLTLLGPVFSNSSVVFSIEEIPPKPTPTATPASLKRSSATPESLTATSVAARHIWINRSFLRISFASRKSSGLNPDASPANLTGRSSASNKEIDLTPLRDSLSDLSISSLVIPIGVIAPIPVITTRFLSIFNGSFNEPFAASGSTCPTYDNNPLVNQSHNAKLDVQLPSPHPQCPQVPTEFIKDPHMP